MALAETIVVCLGVYFGAGVIVALLFLSFGVSHIDHAAKGASAFFRPMVFLGCVALWPYIILRFLSLKKINQPDVSPPDGSAS
ncbi:MAG: hypothetical protein GXP06_11920 [Alphaproteobacteria bacterium]|nr:hypothetical protein [Alphaproteobacteria bacterium]